MLAHHADRQASLDAGAQRDNGQHSSDQDDGLKGAAIAGGAVSR
jgi:hypothetical protein